MINDMSWEISAWNANVSAIVVVALLTSSELEFFQGKVFFYITGVLIFETFDEDRWNVSHGTLADSKGKLVTITVFDVPKIESLIEFIRLIITMLLDHKKNLCLQKSIEMLPWKQALHQQLVQIISNNSIFKEFVHRTTNSPIGHTFTAHKDTRDTFVRTFIKELKDGVLNLYSRRRNNRWKH